MLYSPTHTGYLQVDGATLIFTATFNMAIISDTHIFGISNKEPSLPERITCEPHNNTYLPAHHICRERKSIIFSLFLLLLLREIFTLLKTFVFSCLTLVYCRRTDVRGLLVHSLTISRIFPVSYLQSCIF